MALRHCLDTKPLCECDSEFESLVDALAECGRVPETKFLDLFEACSDDVCTCHPFPRLALVVP